MNLLSIAIIFSFLFFFTKNQKPENVTLYHINCNQDCTYEYKVLKGEIFGFEFSRARGSCCEWELLNRTLLNEFYTIQFLKSYIYDYISENYQKALEKQKEEEEKRKEEITKPIEPIIELVGGSEFYYEVFKAVHETNSPQKLKFIYTCCSDYIYTNVSINILVCDEIIDNKCINKKKCSEIESPSKENCENFITSNKESKCIFDKKNNKCTEKIISKCLSALNIKDKKECFLLPTSDDVRLKCTLKIEGDNKNCREEEKKCLEIINGATEEICMNAITVEENRICVLDNITNSCTEIIKEDGGNYNNLSFILFIISFIFLC